MYGSTSARTNALRLLSPQAPMAYIDIFTFTTCSRGSLRRLLPREDGGDRDPSYCFFSEPRAKTTIVCYERRSVCNFGLHFIQFSPGMIFRPASLVRRRAENRAFRRLPHRPCYSFWLQAGLSLISCPAAETQSSFSPLLASSAPVFLALEKGGSF